MPDYLNYNFWNPEDKRKDRQEDERNEKIRQEKINDTLSKK
tara:strand:- start:631 stop:753 length:123 start_codon:yes stop_codon:yes gene_type:complete